MIVLISTSLFIQTFIIKDFHNYFQILFELQPNCDINKFNCDMSCNSIAFFCIFKFDAVMHLKLYYKQVK
jgi:hypothetical protein